jgi:G-protein coupled receptor 98
LDEHFWVILSSHGERESKLGCATLVNITILKNDYPHGIIEFVSDGLSASIKESKGEDIYHGKLFCLLHFILFSEEDINLFSA